MQLRSSALTPGHPIPVRYSGDGEDLSPPLTWGQVPEGTRELLLICDDPDAPTPQPWVHWVLYGIPADTRSLSEGVSHTAEIPGVEGQNSWKTKGYRGPAPPRGHGIHHYHFRLYALNAALQLRPGLDQAAVLHAAQGHILAEAELVGTYERR